MHALSSNDLTSLEKALGYTFKKKPLLKEAITHKSYAHEKQNRRVLFNERMEFLGDAVLELIISEHLYASHLDYTEADLKSRTPAHAGYGKGVPMGSDLPTHTGSGAPSFMIYALKDPIGGNLLTEASLELIFPTPFAPESRSVRTFLFADAGNVFETERSDIVADFDVTDLRTSVGVGLTWLTAIGPLSFNLAKALNDQTGDDTEVFQFSLGQTF